MNEEQTVTPEFLEEFYAVTRNSVYRVRALGLGRAEARKIAPPDDKNSGEVRLNDDIAGGKTVEIGRNLHTNSGGRSTSIVALFLRSSDALACLAAKGLPCDLLWLGQTKAVLEKIGTTHPSFRVCRVAHMALIPSIRRVA